MTRLRQTRDSFCWTLRNNYYQDQRLEIMLLKEIIKVFRTNAPLQLSRITEFMSFTLGLRFIRKILMSKRSLLTAEECE